MSLIIFWKRNINKIKFVLDVFNIQRFSCYSKFIFSYLLVCTKRCHRFRRRHMNHSLSLFWCKCAMNHSLWHLVNYIMKIRLNIILVFWFYTRKFVKMLCFLLGLKSGSSSQYNNRVATCIFERNKKWKAIIINNIYVP